MTYNTEKLKKHTLYIIACIVITLACYLIYSFIKPKAPEVTSVSSTATQDIRPFFPMESDATIKDISKQAQRAKETQAPKYHYYTTTQDKADKMAQNFAQKQRADALIKDSNKAEIEWKDGSKGHVIENDYYAINLERKHKIKAGAAMIDGDAYVSLGYQNRTIEYKIYYAPSKKEIGVGAEVTVAKW